MDKGDNQVRIVSFWPWVPGSTSWKDVDLFTEIKGISWTNKVPWRLERILPNTIQVIQYFYLHVYPWIWMCNLFLGKTNIITYFRELSVCHWTTDLAIGASGSDISVNKIIRNACVTYSVSLSTCQFKRSFVYAVIILAHNCHFNVMGSTNRIFSILNSAIYSE